MAEGRDAVERLEKRFPSPALRRERLAAGRCDPIEAPPALAGLLDPAPLDQSPPLEPVEERIERRDPEANLPVGALLDELRDLVPVTLLLLDQGQHQHLGAAPLQIARAHVFRRHI
jgi:hypothetical protein